MSSNVLYSFQVYYEFLYTISRADLSDFVIPLAATTATAFDVLRTHELQADIVHLDTTGHDL